MHPDIIPATGLTVVVPHDNPALDIVFVHGFTGHPERTWTHKRGDARQPDDGGDEAPEPPPKAPRLNPFSKTHQSKDSAHSGVYWPRDLLPTTVPHARVLTYGYDTHIRHWADQPISHNTVRDIAWDLLVALEAGRRDDPARPLLFAAHSLGGIVVKEMLRRSSGCRQGRAHLRDVFESTTGVMFFGTPHGGADPRGILQHTAELVIKAVGFKVNQQIVNTLLPSSERLKELSDEFGPMAHEQEWKIHSFQEELGVRALNGRKVVEDTSSYLNLPAIEVSEHIGRNHMDMCRFTGPKDVEYAKVAAALRRMTTELFKSRSSAAMPSLSKDYREQLRDSLGFEQIDARHANIKKAHAKTCSWLKTRDEYLDWLDPSKIPEHHGVLWIKGKPGAGKSTIMKFAFDQARKTMKDKIVLSFFFNARGRDLEHSTSGMYRSLLLQLLQRMPELDSIFDSLRLTSRPEGGQMQWSIELLKDLFEQALQNLGQSSVVCFIDALDESHEDEIRDMISFFEHIGEQVLASNIRFQVCFSSRHYPHITIARGLGLVLEGQEEHEQDITNYVESELKIGHSEVAEDIRTELRARASGVFMWVVLVVNILNKEHDRGRVHGLRQRLQEIPTDLHDLFRDILTRDTRDKDELILCIQWILFARRPLKPEELYFAIFAGIDDDPFKPWDHKLITPATIRRFLIDSSKGLAETTESKAPVVQFIHESVRDFLLKDNGLQKIWPDLGDQFQGKSHDQLKEYCQKYIGTDYKPSLIHPSHKWVQRHFPFLIYALFGILYHAEEAESSGISQKCFLQTFPLEKWIWFHNIIEKFEVRYRTPSANLLHQAASDSFLGITKLLLQVYDKEGRDNAGRTPLYWAAWKGHSAVVNLLLESGADPNASDKDGHTPFSRAIQNNDAETVRLLIKQCANCDVKNMDMPGKPLLSWAARNGHSVIVKLGVETGADKEARWEGLTPMLWAGEEGFAAIVRLLIEAGADKEAKTGTGQTVLSRAAWNGRLDIVNLLLQAGADKEATDNRGQTPLYSAIQSYDLTKEQRSDVVRMLIKAGANMEARDRDGWIPLLWAINGHKLDIVELLVKAGANMEARDRYRQTPLHSAVESKNVTTVELLVEAGADKEARDKAGRTPLLLAARYGQVAIARLLLGHGANKDVEDAQGKTPLTWATKNCNIDLMSLLE